MNFRQVCARPRGGGWNNPSGMLLIVPPEKKTTCRGKDKFLSISRMVRIIGLPADDLRRSVAVRHLDRRARGGAVQGPSGSVWSSSSTRPSASASAWQTETSCQALLMVT
jgi:hypothetical protein